MRPGPLAGLSIRAAPVGTIICMPLSLNSPLAICVAEDRKSCDPALRLLLIRLSRYSTNIAVTVSYPQADQQFIDWANAIGSVKISVRTAPVKGAYGSNVWISDH
jgi:hypothetical protein